MEQDVLAVLTRIDPLGIADPSVNSDAQNEYRPEANSLTPRLSEAVSIEDCQRLVWEELSEWFSESIAGSIESYRQIGEELWRVLNTHHSVGTVLRGGKKLQAPSEENK